MLWKKRYTAMANPEYSTRVGVANIPAMRLSMYSRTMTSTSAWMAKAPGEITYLLSDCGELSSMSMFIFMLKNPPARQNRRLATTSSLTIEEGRI